MNPKNLLKNPPPVFLFNFMQNIRISLKTLCRKMVPPKVAVFEMATSHWLGYALYGAASVGVADQFKKKEKKHISDLARETETDEETLYRMMRILASNGVFKEVHERVFSMTPMAENLKSTADSVKNIIMFQYADYFQKGMSDIVYALKTGRPSLEKSMDGSLFEYFESNPEDAAYFNNAMTSNSMETVSAVSAVYDFTPYKKIVDFGGGHGTFLAHILSKNTTAQGVLYDLPQVVDGSDKTFKKSNVDDRVEIIGGDFFKSVPDGGDLYVGRNILHSWDDDECCTILRNINSAMDENGKLLLVDAVITKDNKPSFGKMLDLNILVVSNGKERTKDEFLELLHKSGFKLNRIIPMSSVYSIIEAVKA